ncbi:MAG: hypothetical protein SFV32_07290 [Opitutaceae bacterium]|nr:hypothetical protein [Opitutaceae bacterium]
MIENENGLLTVVQFDAAHGWDQLVPLCSEHLTRGGLTKLRRLLDTSVRTVAIERHYIDRDYRDTFSGFHSKKFVTPSSRTVRLHFFTAPITTRQLRERKVDDEQYVGYSIIRPTRPNCIGRTLLNPKFIRGLAGTLCRCREKVSLQGTELPVEGFPFISQDGDATVCAESATWMVVRYFSNRYRAYREMQPFKITTATQNYARGERVYPSRGLHLWQMAETLRREGFAPLTYFRENYQEEFEDLLYTYIESGFPVFAMLQGHVVVALGHHSDYTAKLPTAKRFVKSSYFNRSFVVNDDNFFPYQRIEPKPAIVATKTNPMISGYSLEDVVAFSVPLPEKVFLAAEEFHALVDNLLSDHRMGIDAHSPILQNAPVIIIRQFLTTCRSFKQHLQDRGMGSAVVRDVYYDIPLPHFIWVCELTTPNLYESGKQHVWGEVLWDATRNAHEPAGFIAVHYPEKLWIDAGSALNQSADINEWSIDKPTPYPLFRSNLLEL